MGPVVQLSRFKKRTLKTFYRFYDLVSDGDKYIRYSYYHNGYHNPNYEFGKDQIAFLHIPKTGGSSLAKMLVNDPEDRFINLNIHKPVANKCQPKDFRYLTVMRDPVDRVWSYYQMVLRSPEGYPYLNFAKKGLAHFLEKCWAARNLSCRYIAGSVEPEPTKETLQQAQQNLDSFYAVLAFAHFQDEVSGFMQRHSIPFELIPNERKSTYAQPSRAEIELIKGYNQLDTMLFDYWKNNRSDK